MGDDWGTYKRLVEDHIKNHVEELKDNKECHAEINRKLDAVIIELAKISGRDSILRVIGNCLSAIAGGIIVTLFGHFIKK